MLFQPILALDMNFFQVGKIIGGGGGQNDMFAPPPPPNIFIGGHDGPPGSTPLPRGGGGGRVGFFIFRLENVQSGAYLRRKFRLDDTNINKSLVWK